MDIFIALFGDLKQLPSSPVPTAPKGHDQKYELVPCPCCESAKNREVVLIKSKIRCQMQKLTGAQTDKLVTYLRVAVAAV